MAPSLVWNLPQDLDAFAKKLSAVEAGKADLEGRTAKTISVLNSVRMCVINLARLSSSDVGEAHDIGLETLPEQLQKVRLIHCQTRGGGVFFCLGSAILCLCLFRWTDRTGQDRTSYTQ